MGDYKEVRLERLYVQVPNTDKLRKTAAGRHRHLLAAGWREVERKQEIDHIRVRYERAGPIPLKFRLPKGGSEAPRMERRPRGQFGGGGGGRGGRGGPRGGGRGGGAPSRGAPSRGATTPSPGGAPSGGQPSGGRATP